MLSLASLVVFLKEWGNDEQLMNNKLDGEKINETSFFSFTRCNFNIR